MVAEPTADGLVRRKLKRSEYDQLVASGALDDERVELIFGEMVAMSPQKGPHIFTSRRLLNLFAVRLQGRALVQGHTPIGGAGESVPEPDVAVIPLDDERADGPSERTLLVIEVADSSRTKDLGVKARLYALSEVPEYWVVDLNRRAVRVFTEPDGSEYRLIRTVGAEPGVTLAPQAFPDVEVTLADIFPPAE
jgi:Uma2 family endonuclease